ncbi:hypothetical protein KDI_37070 [Dictyobacter arantiisoli]|uniref:Uncharacterized protein n=1 Tax=Dictyobacter arantiisoli TaxID=2014874 RepID=A0A5A5TGE5_9CHLR|nr:hypothetical protein KDI_37070 [Dictyobacter arantiisoli]
MSEFRNIKSMSNNQRCLSFVHNKGGKFVPQGSDVGACRGRNRGALSSSRTTIVPQRSVMRPNAILEIGMGLRGEGIVR